MVVGICVGFCRKHLCILIPCFTFVPTNGGNAVFNDESKHFFSVLKDNYRSMRHGDMTSVGHIGMSM